MSSGSLSDLVTAAIERTVPLGVQLMGLRDWMGAVESYEKTLNSTMEPDSFERGELEGSLAFAYYNAAMRSSANHQFRELLGRSIANYEKAAKSYSDSTRRGSEGRSLRCAGMTAYLRSWSELEAPERKKLLEEAWSKTKQSLKILEEASDGLEYGITFNRLSIAGGFQFYLEWNFPNRKKLIDELACLGEQAINFLSSAGSIEELVRAYVKTAEFLGAFGDEFLDLNDENRENSDRKARGYLKKAFELSKENVVHELAHCFPPACWVVLDWDLDQWISTCEAELEYRKKTNEVFPMGWMADWLAEFQVEKSRACADPDARSRFIRRALQYAEEARNYYSIVSLKSPRAGPLWVEVPDPEFLWQLGDWESDGEQRQERLESAWKASENLMKTAEDSGIPEVVSYAHSVLSKILTSIAQTETDQEKSRTLLETALEHANKSLEIDEQILPFRYRKRGLDLNYLADIESELGKRAKELGLRRELFDRAIWHKETGIMLCSKWLQFYERRFPYPEPFALLGLWESELGDLLVHLNELTKSESDLQRSLACFENAIEFFGKPDLAARIAESYWKSANTYDLLGEYSRAADMFDEASENYRTAAQKVPQLRSLYLDHSTYMQAWSEIEKARHHHEGEEYAEAANYYRIASKLHDSTSRWNSLGPIYAAWSHVEEAEDLSRMEHGDEAVQVLRKASALFDECRKSLLQEMRKTEDREQRLTMTEGKEWSSLGSEFCKARGSLEEAKLFDRKGDHRSSSRRYGEAAETFEKIMKEHEVARGAADLRFIAKVARAWEIMTQAEYYASPQQYLQASRLFEEARQLSRNEKAGWLVLGHSHFCTALESGTSLVDKGSLELTESVRRYFESAAACYAKAGSQNALQCAEASKLLFEALTQMTLASKEADSTKKAMLFSMAETVLLASADSFMKAGFAGKKEEVLRLVGKASIEKTLALSLTEILHAPSLISSRQTIETDLPALNTSSSPDWFEQAYVHQNVAVHKAPSELGQVIVLDVTLVNAGRSSAKLARLEGLVSEELELVTPPEEYPVTERLIDLGGRVLHPLNALSFKIVLKPRFQGFFTLSPVLSYLDEKGASRSQQLGPVDVLASPIVEFLAGCFSADYNTKRLSENLAGWRSLMEVVGSMKLSRSNVYGDARYGHTFSKPLELLIKSGLVESRVFPGERGRGGKILKIRVCYDRGPMRRLIDEMAFSPFDTGGSTSHERRLSAIMFTDLVGYTSLTEKNEPLALELLAEHRRILRNLFLMHHGNEVKTVGDMFLVEFSSALEAVRCAVEVQRSLSQRNLQNPQDRKISVRIGVHVGDIEHRQHDVYGDAVNVASRIHGLAKPSGIVVTRQVYEQIRSRPDINMQSLGNRQLKNIKESLELFSVSSG